jgi:hypothetical protein
MKEELLNGISHCVMGSPLRRHTRRKFRMHRKTDSEIEQFVLRELSLSKEVRSPEICVLARDGVVSLRGSVQTVQNRSAAEQAARCATGVVGVVNDLRVKLTTAVAENASSAVLLSGLPRVTTYFANQQG